MCINPILPTPITSAADAWAALRFHGLEATGRDGDLADLLHKALLDDPEKMPGVSFKDAVDAASLEKFIRAFFDCAAPYVDMLKDILAWFERADAKRSAHAWQLAWDGGDLAELQQFREYLKQLETTIVVLEHPALAFNECFLLLEKMRSAPGISRVSKLVSKENYRALPESMRDFAYYYKLDYGDLSNLVPPAGSPGWLMDVWHLIQRATMELALLGISGQTEALSAARAALYRRTEADGLAPDSVCMLETDNWLLYLVACYAVLLESPADRAAAGPVLNTWFSALPRVSFLAEDTVESFTAFLSLPLWGKRHEFYAAWIASRIIDAAGEHELNLLHDKGVISLPFSRTEVAHVVSARPERILFSERREPVEDPQGKGRVDHVQPDFSIWHAAAKDDVCDLVVEVKHYQSPAKKSWVDVFEDYAKAHPAATVVLVNYGRPGNAMDGVSAPNKARCRLIGNLRPSQKAAVDELAKAVRNALGPVLSRPGTGGAGGSRPSLALVLDRSYSIQVARSDLLALVERYAALYDATHVAIAATGRDTVWMADASGFDAALDAEQNSETQFTPILSRLLADHPDLIFLTDADGDGSLDRTVLHVHELDQGPDGIRILQVAAR